MSEQEKRIEAEVKLEAVKAFIFSLYEKYENLQDADNFDDLQVFEKNEINGKVEVLSMIKEFIFNNI